MTKSEIRTIVELFISWNGETEPLDIANLDSAVDYISECLPSLPSDLDEAAEEYQEQVRAHFLRTLDHPSAKDAFKAGAELVMSELFKKLHISPLKIIGRDENGYPVYDFEVGHYYPTFTLFGKKYKQDQTISGEAGEKLGAEWMAQQGVTIEGVANDGEFIDTDHGILSFDEDKRPFDDGDKVIVQIRKK